SLKTSIKTITYLSDIGCLEIQGASLSALYDNSASEYFENSDNKLSILFLSPSCLWQTTVFAPFSLPRRATEEEKSI
ncbi:hypothetical protein, partial [Escherichia coli]|uniref:hypothetical protein n=1 Tax=Escherichia coli TaxID=562 RepID=UPI003D972A78